MQFMHICMHTFIHACIHAYMHACIHADLQTDRRRETTDRETYTYLVVHAFVFFACFCVYRAMHVEKPCMRVCIYMHIYIYIYIYICICIMYIHIAIYTYTGSSYLHSTTVRICHTAYGLQSEQLQTGVPYIQPNLAL